MKTSQDWGMFGTFAICGMFFIMKSCLEGFRENCKSHWVEHRVCTASLTHCCFPDSFLPSCTSCAFSFDTFKRSLCRCLFLLASPICSCQDFQALMPTSGCCSFSAEGEPQITGGQHEVRTREWWPRPRTRNQQNCSAEWLGSGKRITH